MCVTRPQWIKEVSKRSEYDQVARLVEEESPILRDDDSTYHMMYLKRLLFFWVTEPEPIDIV